MSLTWTTGILVQVETAPRPHQGLTWAEQLGPEVLVILKQLRGWHLQQLQHFLPCQVLQRFELLGSFAFEHLRMDGTRDMHHPQHRLIQLGLGSHLEPVH